MRRTASLAFLSLLAGCTVGPDYHAADLPVPPSFAEPQAVAAPADLARWWQGFGDPELDRLVTLALTQGLDVQSAASRIRQARAAETAARAGGLPQIDASANATHVHFSKNAGLSSLSRIFGGGASSGATGSSGGIAAPGDGVTTYAIGFDASWEIDLFGGVRRSVEGARARTQVAEWEARDTAVSLAADVADAYLQLRLAQAREGVARAEVARQTRALQITGETAEVGLVPQGDSIRQRAQLADAQAAIEPLVAEQHIQMHTLGVLLGRSPDILIAELTVAGVATTLPVVPAGLPSDLLRRRPDVRVAERRLAAATADIGVAVADLYPRFSLTGMAQLISTSLSTLLSSNSFQGTGTGGVSFPLLDFGRRRSVVRQREEAATQAYVAYQQAVLDALKDVEDALMRIDTERRRNAVLIAGVADADRAVKAVSARYETGLSNLTPVLDAQASLLSQRDRLQQSDVMLRRDTASLYKALGGGWSDDDSAAADPVPRSRLRPF